MNVKQSGEMFWFVMRVTYQRELQVKAQLEAMDIHCFLPIINDVAKVRGKFVYKSELVLHNILFVYSTFERLLSIKTEQIPILRYVMTKDEDAQMNPMIVPQDQMERFMKVCLTKNANIKYYKPTVTQLNLTVGEKVRVLAGPFMGLTGTFVRFKREKYKRVVVELEGLIGVATEAIPPELVEKI